MSIICLLLFCLLHEKRELSLRFSFFFLRFPAISNLLFIINITLQYLFLFVRMDK